MMKFALALGAALAFTAPAFADSPVSAEEKTKIEAVLTEMGCKGGEFEKETEGSGVFEVDDTDCKSGQYDVKLDSKFKVITMSAD